MPVSTVSDAPANIVTVFITYGHGRSVLFRSVSLCFVSDNRQIAKTTVHSPMTDHMTSSRRLTAPRTTNPAAVILGSEITTNERYFSLLNNKIN